MKILMKNKPALLVVVLAFLSALFLATSIFFSSYFADSASKFLPYMFGFSLVTLFVGVALALFLAVKKIRSCPPKSESKWEIVAVISVVFLILVTAIVR